jgi:peroxiredoxin Q/BCP
MIKEGQKAPAFKLPSTEGEDVSLKDLAGKTVVLYFYPRDMTPGCTTEACDFRDAKKALEKKGAVVYGVSKDSIETHGKFIDKYDLNFPLLTDKKAEVMEKYGAWGEKTMYGKKVTTTVVIGPDGKVKKVFPNVKVKGHVEKVLAAIDE